MGESDDLEREVARLRDALEAERRVSEQWRKVAEDRRVAMERLRQRRAVRILFAVAQVVLPFLRIWRQRVRHVQRRLRRIAGGLVGARHRLTAGRREAALRKAVGRLPGPRRDARRVAIVVLTRDGRHHLERLLPRLRSLEHDRSEVVVVDNASAPETQRWLDEQPGVRVVRNSSNLSYSAANNAAAAATDSDVLLFLNDDVEPLDDLWLGRMLDALAGDVVAVGAQLAYPRRSLLDGRMRDVSVQHLGITLEPDGDGPPQAVNRAHGADVDPERATSAVAGVTGACLLVERAAFEAVGGFDDRYDYGAEDVDLCWRLRQAGGEIVVVPSAVLWHREGATRFRDDPEERRRRQHENWRRLAERFGPQMRRAVDEDRLLDRGVLSDRPFRVGITVTRDLESAGYGDWYTAHDLGAALGGIGWDVTYLERYRDAWYGQAADLDAVIVLHDVFDVRRVARPGLTTVAWVRNWTDRWLGHPWFDSIDVVVASSARSAELIRASSRHRLVSVLPLATNPARFPLGAGDRDGAVLTANHWGEDRGVTALVAAVPSLRLYGKGWDDVPEVAGAWHGHLGRDELAATYGRSMVVVDQTAAPTRPFGAVNSRVFDALAAGALPVTDQAAGVEELFGGLLPTWDTPDELAATLKQMLADREASLRRAHEARELVLRDHTFDRRAQQFADILREHRHRASVVVRIGAPSRKEAANWGDTFFAEALVAELRAAGHHADWQTLDEWEDRRGFGFDVSLQLKGRSRCRRADGQVHAIWVISHPDEVDPGEIAVADAAFAAAPLLAAELSHQSGTAVHVLPQATDERRFRPRRPDPQRATEVVFVGNSRFAERPLVRDAVAAGLPVTIHGANWERYVHPSVLGERFVANEEVPVVYSSAKVVLNDHWEDMRRWGLVSNRVFDALACGACVVSDPVAGLDDLFGDAVATAEGVDDVGRVVRDLLADDDRRAEMGRRGRQAVLDGHTFRHRVEQLLEVLVPLAIERTGAGKGPR